MESDKIEIIKKLKNISYNQACKDYLKLVSLNHVVSNETRIGNKFIDHFTFPQRLETKGIKDMSYWDFISNDTYLAKPYISKMINYQTNKGIEHYTGLYSIFKLHCGSIGLFKPCRAKELVCQFNGTRILDPFLGWGCRLVGSCAANAHSYIGIDSNIALQQPIELMSNTLRDFAKTQITIIFNDANTVDYSKYEYDMVLSSPPYWNLEIYENMKPMTKNEWKVFYTSVFSKTFKHLLVGGWYVINILEQIYNDVLEPLLGSADIILPLKKKQNSKLKSCKPNEFIYCWKKVS